MRAGYSRAASIAAGFLATFGVAVARADERLLPVPRATIYPGDVIEESMVEERPYPAGGMERNFVETRDGLIGKVARRTLLPHQSVMAVAIDHPRVVTLGAHVKIVFAESGLTITAYGTAMESGGAGDTIRVRNQDSGLTVSGRIFPDGSVRVSEG